MLKENGIKEGEAKAAGVTTRLGRMRIFGKLKHKEAERELVA